MRGAILSCLLLTMAGCSQQPPQIDRIEMKTAGWPAAEVSIERNGEGRYQHYNDLLPGKLEEERLSIPPGQFADLVRRLEIFRAQAVPFNDETIQAFIMQRCPAGVPQVTDAGRAWVHWIGPSVNVHYAVDFGCDHERHAERNDALRALLEGLPVPKRGHGVQYLP
jgi:hypothetical protein